jgi:hypothetical protein
MLATSRGVLASGDGNQTITNAKFISGNFMGIEVEAHQCSKQAVAFL